MNSGWPKVRLEELVSKVGSGATPRGGERAYKSKGVPLIRSMNVIFFGFNREGLVYLDGQQARALKGAEVRAGDVLLNITGASIGRVTIAPEDMDGARVNQHVCIIRPLQGVDPRYLQAFLSTPEMQGQIGSSHYGATRQALTKEQILSFEIPVAPHAVQLRIAEKIESLGIHLASARVRVQRAAAFLAEFRKSLLDFAVSGKLTADWRRSKGLTWEAWRKTVFADVCKDITVGYVGKMAVHYRETGIPFLRSLNVRPLYFDNRDLRYISSEFHKSLAKSTLRPGDVVVVRTGTPGQCCVIPPEVPEANCSDLVIVRPGPELLSHFAAIYINSERLQEFVRNERVGVAQAHFNVGSMKQAPLLLPTLDEQGEILRRVESLLADANRVQTRYEAARQEIDQLLPALLSKAFRGLLVPQFPDDEPATVLLERLRSTQASALHPKPIRRQRRSSTQRAPREKAAMTKSRHDEDVKHKPYLAELLRGTEAPERAEDLFRRADLPITDFYKQLVWEVSEGHIRESPGGLEVG